MSRGRPARSDFWTFVEHNARALSGDAPLCKIHPNYAPKAGKPRTLCEGCWGFFINYKRILALHGEQETT